MLSHTDLRERVGVKESKLVPIQSTDRCNFFLVQREVEDAKILVHVCLGGRLRNGRQAALQVPSEDDLRGSVSKQSKSTELSKSAVSNPAVSKSAV